MVFDEGDGRGGSADIDRGIENANARWLTPWLDDIRKWRNIVARLGTWIENQIFEPFVGGKRSFEVVRKALGRNNSAPFEGGEANVTGVRCRKGRKGTTAQTQTQTGYRENILHLLGLGKRSSTDCIV